MASKATFIWAIILIFGVCEVVENASSCCVNANCNARIAYFISELNERGTTVATFDYAVFNTEFIPRLGCPLILYGTEKAKNDLVEKIFVDEFGSDSVLCVTWERIDDSLLQRHNITHLYYLNPNKYITTDHIPTSVRLLLHYSFDFENSGSVRCDVCAKVSPVVRGDIPIVPHIVRQDISILHGPNMRNSLGIPPNATVFCRHGGYGQFDAQFVKEVIKVIATSTRRDIYFVFVNTEPFTSDDPREFVGHDRVFYLDTIVNLDEKSRFIRTCDALLHARSRGETFGLAVAEFSAHNRPVITYDRGRSMSERHHINTLGSRGMVFKNSGELSRLLLQFNRTKAALEEWNAYAEYSPERVTKIFENIFLNDDPASHECQS